jgi:carboxypeptidase C (cathepsin A)
MFKLRRFVSCLLLFSAPLLAKSPSEETPSEESEPSSELLDEIFATEHSLTIGGQTIAYTAITGRLPLYNEEGEESAKIFFTAFMKSEPEEARPITFAFPGGPGGSCCPESICSFGPKRLPLVAEGKPKRPPYSLVDNERTLLFSTDLVFVDPVETGYSTVEEGDEYKYRSASGDLMSLSSFVVSYLSTFQKWNSPIYLSGISYGTTRACGISFLLTSYFGLPIRGLILMGNAVDLNLLDHDRDRYLPDCLLIPTLAATAWYHERLWPERSIEEVVDYARRFAYEDYSPAMAQPNRLNRYEKEELFKALAELTGLPLATIERYNGRISEEIFTTEFLAPSRQILGGLDSRYKGDMSNIKRWWIEEDPSYREEVRGLLPTFTHYLQTELSCPYAMVAPYASFSSHGWYFDVTDLFFYLRRTLVANPDLQIFCANGYYDCRTPFAAAEYCFDHLDLPEGYKRNIDFKYYEAGHGLIFDAEVLKKLHKDLVKFYSK